MTTLPQSAMVVIVHAEWYSDIVRSEEVVRMYVGWLFSQIEDPIQSGHDYPLFESHLLDAGRNCTARHTNLRRIESELLVTEKRRLLDMSANAPNAAAKGGFAIEKLLGICQSSICAPRV